MNQVVMYMRVGRAEQLTTSKVKEVEALKNALDKERQKELMRQALTSLRKK